MGQDERLKQKMGGETGITNTVLTVSNKGKLGVPGQQLLVIGNTSAALVEGVISSAPIGRYDAYDSGSQMVLFCPDGSTLVVQIPGDKLTPENTALALRMYEFQRASLAPLGFNQGVTVEFTGNAHSYVEALLNDPKANVAIMPLFPSERLFGDHEAAISAGLFNNKPNFLDLVDDLSRDGVDVLTPTTFLCDVDRYATGFPPVEDLIKLARLDGASTIFFKQNVSAGGFGVEKVDVTDRKGLKMMYDKWVSRMNNARADASGEWDFHIQLGIPSPEIIDGAVNSPCIIAVIEPDGDGFQSPQILQVAQQRLKDGTHHIGNKIDPKFEAAFIERYGDALSSVLNALAQQGVRGHIGLDSLIDSSGQLYLIEVNPRLNGNSRVRMLRDKLPDSVVITTNNTFTLPEGDLERVGGLAEYFFDPTDPQRPSLAIARFPRFVGDVMAIDFINDLDGSLEAKVTSLFA